MNPSIQTIPIFYNLPQIRSMAVAAPVEILIAGRGTGKTEGVLAYKSAACYLHTMPRGAGVIVGRTYNQILTRTLPGLTHGWERMGYKRDVHFVVGKRPTEAWKKLWSWDGPFRMPEKFHYCISWWNGAIIYLVSQDIEGSSNGITIDWIIGDEAKYLKHEKFNRELLPANRGIVPQFRNNIYHHGMTLTTDMPTGAGSQWLMELEDKCDKVKVEEIKKLQVIISKLVKEAGEKTKKEQRFYEKQIDIILEEINELRSELIYFHEASALDNIHAVGGMKWLKNQMNLSTQFEFDTQILNLRITKVENGFYPDFDEEIHGYHANNNSFLQSLGFDFSKIEDIDCRRDADLDPNLALHISIDYNRRIHPLVVAQDKKTELKILNGLHVLYPKKLKDVVKIFCEYYKPHKKKVVYYWYDQTAVGEQFETRQCDDVVKELRKYGWAVVRQYMGVVPTHQDKYNMYDHLLSEDGYYIKTLRMNKENCSALIRSINFAPAEIRKGGFGKVKLSEKDPNFPAVDSTHFSDALDMLVWGLLESKLKYTSPSGSSIITGKS
jgi:hypothetical protein